MNHNELYTITADITEGGSPIITLPNGTVYDNIKIWRNDSPQIIDEATIVGLDPQIVFVGRMEMELEAMTSNHLGEQESEDGMTTIEQPFVQYFSGGYVASSSCTRNAYVRGCVSSWASKCSIRLNCYSSQIFDMHIAKYTRNGRACFGAYESVRMWSYCVCNPINMSWVRNAIYTAAIYTGIGVSTALFISEILAPLVFVPLLAL